jgi:CHAT domain-containing protein
LQEAINVLKTAYSDKHPVMAAALTNLALINAATGRPQAALDLMRQSAAIEDNLLGEIFSISSESQRLNFALTLQEHLAIFLSLVLKHFSEVPALILEAFDLVLRRKAIGAEALAAQRDAVLGGYYPDLKDRLKELFSLRRLIARTMLAGPEKMAPELYRQRLQQLEDKRDELEVSLARKIPEININQRLNTANSHAVAAALMKGSVLVEFVRFSVCNFKSSSPDDAWQPARYVAFVMHAGESDQIHMKDLGEAHAIERLIDSYRDSIIRGMSARSSEPEVQFPPSDDQQPASFRLLVRDEPEISIHRERSYGTALRNIVFEPLVSLLSGCKRLFISPDGDLSRLSFEVLPAGGDNWLIDEYVVSYLTVGRDVLRFNMPGSDPSSAPIVAADPDFDLVTDSAQVVHPDLVSGGLNSKDMMRGDRVFKRLPGTRLEGEQVSAKLHVKPLLDKMVLETKLKACQSPVILHVATHGFFLSDQQLKFNAADSIVKGRDGHMISSSNHELENPLLRSGLALAGINTWSAGGILPAEAEDGILTAEDVSGMSLLATKLVVLSACDTGLGEIQVGEGVFGLQRAFTLAGARTLVMSLWKIPDLQTQELMLNFYDQILANAPSAEALRQAQLAMKAKHPEPLYWGAFICQGDPSPLSID